MNTPEPTPLRRQFEVVWQVDAEIEAERLVEQIEAWMNQEESDG